MCMLKMDLSHRPSQSVPKMVIDSIRHKNACVINYKVARSFG